ncbi:MAG: DUF5117 domain-containing protein [Segetibacter sp.]
MILLPAKPMSIRYWDRRVGFFLKILPLSVITSKGLKTTFLLFAGD